MKHEAAFLQALLDDPDDLGGRLVFADWLEEQGDPRAEFLRVQAELAAWVPDLERRSELQRREQEWLRRHGPERLLGQLTGLCSHFVFEGGLARVTLPLARFATKRFAARGAGWLRGGWVRTLRLEGIGYAVAAACPGLTAVAGFDLSCQGLDDEAAAVLLSSPHLTGLRELDLSGNRLTGSGLRHVLRLPALSGLVRLDLRNNGVDGKSLPLLLQELEGRPLRHLRLHGNPLGDAVQEFVAWRQQHDRDKAGGAPRRLINSIGMEFALVPAGTFLMGAPDDEEWRRNDEGPQHPVTISRPFYLGVFQVTQAEYEAVIGSNPARFDRGNGGGPTHPVEQVTWADAVEFCRRLSALPAEKAAGRVYRLPTEAEWEYACRAGTTTPFSMGGPPHAALVNYDGNYVYGGVPRGPYLQRTTPVGSYPPNAFGLYDLHGNVWEWCADWYRKDYYREAPAVDPPGPKRGEQRVARGGCWDCVGWYCRAAHRLGDAPTTRDSFNGFRVALTVPGGGGA
jgi:uncharacterized protein (TIGR02996 family)